MGYLKWSILLCKLADRPAEPQPPSFFEKLFLPKGAGQLGVHDFFDQQSRGRVSMAMSVVKGWFTMPYTYAQVNSAGRGEKIDQCIRTAKAQGYTPPSDHRIAVMLNDPDLESGAHNGRVILDSEGWASGLAVHEMLHSYGFQDSYSDATNPPADVETGMYGDPWDIMSAQSHWGVGTRKFGKGPVGANGPNMEKAGWLPYWRILTAGQDGRTSMTVQLTPLERPDLPGTLLLRVPFDPQNLQRYYTVEFRKKTGVSKGIPQDVALIHEVNGRKSIVLRHRDPNTGHSTEPVTEVNANGVTIKIDSVTADHATVTVTTGMANKCLAGYVFRDAVPGDKVCVTPDQRDQAVSDNLEGPNWENEHGQCILNHTPRKAVPSDSTCVSHTTALRVRSDNATAADRINPTKHFYGVNSCKPGYLWRIADDSDYVCVDQASADQVKADNLARESRWTNGPWGPQSCIYGYVWREAFIGDKVCVTGAVRDRTRLENETAGDRTILW